MSEPRIVLSNLFGPRQDFDSLPWQPFRPGIEQVPVYGDGTGGPMAALLRYAPGAQLPEHEHAALEHIVVLSGSQRDEHGEYAAGTCLIHARGTSHRVSSEHGCVVLALWQAPVLFRSADVEPPRPTI